MNTCLTLSSTSAIGADGEFLDELTNHGLADHWISFKDHFLMPDAQHDSESVEALGRLYCHLNGLAVLIDDSVSLAKIPKRNGFVARYYDLEAVLHELNLQKRWDLYFLGSTFCLLDEQGPRDEANWAIFWIDITRFFNQCGITCKALRPSNQSAEELLEEAASNVSLSGLKATPQLRELANLAANGIISLDDALCRLGITGPRKKEDTGEE